MLFEQAFVDQHDTGEEEIFVDRAWTGPTDEDAARRRRLVATAGAATAVAGVLVAVLVVRLSQGPGQVRDTEDHARSPGVDCAAADGDDPPEVPAGGRTYDADVDGDRCPEQVVVTPEGVVTVDGERWRVGQPGDLITLGDWDCDGHATPAVYRAATGDVFVFSTWASRDEPLSVEPVAQVPNGVALADPTDPATHPADAIDPADPAAHPPPAGQGSCDVLAVQLTSGDVQPVELAG